MKKRALLLPLVALTLLLTACGQKNSDSSSQAASSNSSSTSSKESSSSDSSSSSSSSSSASSTSSATSDSSTSGSQSSSSSNGVTSTKSGTDNNYTIKYVKDGQTFATYHVENLGSTSAAQNGVQDYQSASDNKGLPTVDLGYGIKGAKDAGAGQLYINFPMGKWSLTVHGLNSNTSAAVSTAKSLVSQLQGESLPVPNSIGSVVWDSDAGNIRIQWQDGATLHTVSGSPASTLQLATTLH